MEKRDMQDTLGTNPHEMKKFPDAFTFGASTSAYQIEGAVREGGRTPSIWDVYSGDSDHVYRGQSGEVACDHYHRVDEDIEIMKKIGLDSYHFSISWPRIFPRAGEVNKEGVSFYYTFVEKLNAAGIKPVVTLNHWDIPQWFFELGGWLDRAASKHFVEYAETMFRALLPHEGYEGVEEWITHNEPFCITILGYLKGLHAPGHTDLREMVTAAHHLNLSHGLAVRKFRELQGGNEKIGITLNIAPAEAGADTEEHRDYAELANEFVNHWFLKPLFYGTYPERLRSVYEKKIGPFDFFHDGDGDIFTEPIDFFGLNFYQRFFVRPNEQEMFGYEGYSDEMPVTQEEWKAYPQVLLKTFRMVQEKYIYPIYHKGLKRRLPFIITENGVAMENAEQLDCDASKFGTSMTMRDGIDRIGPDGRVNDEARILYLKAHLSQCLAFIKEGGDLTGYYLWSLMDNFEWALGYSKRFGITYVDFETGKRTIKESGYWYRSVIETRALD